MAKTLLERFNEKYIPEPNSGCWLWTAAVHKTNGYGEIHWGDGHGKKMLLAHVASYLLHVGPTPDGLELDHKCRVRSCVNPEHLEPVTRLVNITRGIGPALTKVRCEAITHCLRGHEYTPENTYTRVKANGYRLRECRTCWGIRKNSRKLACSA